MIMEQEIYVKTRFDKLPEDKKSYFEKAEDKNIFYPKKFSSVF